MMTFAFGLPLGSVDQDRTAGEQGRETTASAQ